MGQLGGTRGRAERVVHLVHNALETGEPLAGVDGIVHPTPPPQNISDPCRNRSDRLATNGKLDEVGKDCSVVFLKVASCTTLQEV